MTSAILKPFEISEDEIKRLGPVQLVQLVKRLIQSDLQLAGIPLSAIQGSLRINVSDGGEDIRVEWSGAPVGTNYIPRSFTVFQLKAEELNNKKFISEPLESDGKTLKPAVQETVTRKGAYVIITSKTNVTTPSRLRSRKTKPKTSTKIKAAKIVPRLDEIRDLLRGTISKFDTATKDIEVDVFGPTKIADWTNTHPMVAIWVKHLLNMASSDFVFQTLEDWSQYADVSQEHISWPMRDQQMKSIRESLQIPKRVVRLLGHAGLGKSRLVYESLKASESDTSLSLVPLVAWAKRFTPEIIHQVRDFIQNRRRVILIIDDCTPEGHRQLSAEVHRTDSMMSMITLDLDFSPAPQGDQEITIDVAPNDVIKLILTSLGVSARPDDLERATQFCAGFPLIAVLVGSALRDGAEHFADFRDNEHIVNKLVWGHGPPDPEILRCLRCIALFQAVGLIEIKNDQIKWIAENLLELSVNQLEEKLERFRERRILEDRGFSILVRPRPLAAQLAAAFWRNATQLQKQRLMDGSMPSELQEALCERLTDLNYLPNARDIAAQLCGKSGPFGSAKVLNSDIGARCLRKLAEVAPESVIETIEREFGNWPISRLKEEVGPGRRWLVWTSRYFILGTVSFQKNNAATLTACRCGK